MQDKLAMAKNAQNPQYVYGIHQPIPKTDSCGPDLVDRDLNLSQVAVLHTSIS